MTELWRLGATQLAEGYRRGDFTPGEVLEACLHRVAATQDLRTVVLVDRVGAKLASSASRLRWARGVPLGPLDGVPISLSDNLHAAGLATTWGSRLLKNFVARKDELPVQRLRAAGAVLIGKTNVSEFGMHLHGGNLVAGATANPWDPARTAGGACGGAAAAVAAGCGALAVATDGAGGLRRPAAHCGVVGFKPSAGRVARDGGLPQLLLDFEVPGAVARTAVEAWHLARALAGEPPADLPAVQPARILYVPRLGNEPVHPGLVAAADQVAQQLQALGHTVEAGPTLPGADRLNEEWPALAQAGLAWMLSDAAPLHEFGLREGQAPEIQLCAPATQEALREALQSDAASLFEVLALVQDVRRRLGDVLAQHDFILTPAAATLPWPLGEEVPGQIAGQPASPHADTVYSVFANAAGLPAVTLPCGRVEGLPCGVQLAGRPGADDALMALAAAWQHAHPAPALWD